MSRRRSKQRERAMTEEPVNRPDFGPPATSGGGSGSAETTGRYIVVFGEGETDPPEVLNSAAGLENVASSREFADQAVNPADVVGADATVFATLGVAVVTADPEQVTALLAAEDSGRAIRSVSPELVHYALDGDPAYVRGYRDGVVDLSSRLLGSSEGGGTDATADEPTMDFADSAGFTWGLHATSVDACDLSGAGIRVAVLDTGFDSSHPDFSDRPMTAQSFVRGEEPQDGHGHGTHCIGTACGPRSPATGPRYGVAHGSEIFVGKVLGDRGSGSDGGIIAGINWAVANGCAVISMSLGADVRQVHPPYTAVGRRALDQGSLIIAAAGNNANRQGGNSGFVGAPANSPYVMAVAALDQRLGVANFSARSLSGRGGQVDIAAPGVQVTSSWTMPTRYKTINGTSMATPHVAGVAALLAEGTGYRGRELWSVLVQDAHRFLAPCIDVGTGLARALK
jgi:subtilisin family serine protease